MYQLCKSIDYIHKLGILHRDIKLENILVASGSGRLKLCDFGFARMYPERGGPLTDYVATRWYRSPELLITAEYGKPVDVWAIGCIMGELIDGQPLFPGDSEVDQLYQIQKVLGKLTPELKELYIKNPRYNGVRLADVSRPETIEKRYLGKITKQGLIFMKSVLKLNPGERLTATEALMHPYFDDLRDSDPYMKKLLELTKAESTASIVPSVNTENLNENPQLQGTSSFSSLNSRSNVVGGLAKQNNLGNMVSQRSNDKPEKAQGSVAKRTGALTLNGTYKFNIEESRPSQNTGYNSTMSLGFGSSSHFAGGLTKLNQSHGKKEQGKSIKNPYAPSVNSYQNDFFMTKKLLQSDPNLSPYAE